MAGWLYDSLQTKLKTLADDVIVYPAHGPGSACGKSMGKETFSTIGIQKESNYAMADQSKEEFISK
jgi:hydroxyacylglutathione hydrolase